jgi:hypothetical protein
MLNLDNIDPDLVLKAQRAAEDKVSGLTTDEWKFLRRRAKTDTIFLGRGILKYDKLSKGLHAHLAKWMNLTVEEQFRIVLLPRGHYKTTEFTKLDSIQAALTDDYDDQPWPRNLGPNCRILLIHEIVESAGLFLEEIANHFLQNETLMGLFPELVPNQKVQRINKSELELPRTELWSEPTFAIMGVGGRSQGRHYNLLKADDLIGDKARDSATEMQKAKDWFDNIQSFFSTFAKDHLDICGTRWAVNDLYAHIFTMYGSLLKRYVRAVEELDPKSGKRVAIFPEEFPLEKLSILRKNKKVWTAQYINDPKESTTLDFKPEWKKYYTWADRRTLATLQGKESQLHTRIRLDDLDISILYDPAMSGNCGFVVTGCDPRNRVFILDAQKKQWKPPEALDYLFKSVMKWHPRVVAIEDQTFSGLYMHWLPREMSLRNIRFQVVPVKTKSKQKGLRIKGLSTYLSAGQIYWMEGMTEFEEEYDNFSADSCDESSNIHILDALAYGPQVWKPGLSKEVWDQYKKVEEELLEQRDITTGYSAI